MMDCMPQIHVAAIHAQAEYNNSTTGLGVLCAMAPDMRVSVGFYRNSLNRHSNYAAIAYQPYRVGPVHVGGMAGVVTGYRSYAIPMAAAVFSLPMGPVELHLAAIPPINSYSPAVAELSVSFHF